MHHMCMRVCIFTNGTELHDFNATLTNVHLVAKIAVHYVLNMKVSLAKTSYYTNVSTIVQQSLSLVHVHAFLSLHFYSHMMTLV